MNGGPRTRSGLGGLVLGVGLGSSTLAGRIEHHPSATDSRTPEQTVMPEVVAPGAGARLDMALGESRIEVMGGEGSVEFTTDRRTVAAGGSRVIPAGTTPTAGPGPPGDLGDATPER